MIKRMAPSLLKATLQRQTRKAAAKLARSKTPAPAPTAKATAAKPTIKMATRIASDVFEADTRRHGSGLGNSIGIARDTDISLARHPGSTPVIVDKVELNVASLTREAAEKLIAAAREAPPDRGPSAVGRDKERDEDTQIHRPGGSVIV